MPNQTRFFILLAIVAAAVGASVFLASGTLRASDTFSATTSSGVAEGGMPGVSEGSEESGALPSYPGEETPALPPQIAEDVPACDFKNYIGLPVEKLDQKAIFGGRPVRVITPGMAVTMDYSAARINILIDEKTRHIVDITCG